MMFDFYEEYQSDSIKARLEANQKRIDAAKQEVQEKPNPQPDPVMNADVIKSVFQSVFPSSSNNDPISQRVNKYSIDTEVGQFHVAESVCENKLKKEVSNLKKELARKQSHLETCWKKISEYEKCDRKVNTDEYLNEDFKYCNACERKIEFCMCSD